MRSFLLLASVIAGAGLSAADPLPGGFRGAHWGDPLSAIMISAPDLELGRTATAVSGECLLAERPFRFVYSGANGMLDRGMYVHDAHHIDSNDDVAVFDAIKALLTEKYGAPASNQELWSNELFKGDRSKLGTALAIAAVVLRAQWSDGKNAIILQAKGKNTVIAVTVTYGRFPEVMADTVSADDSADRKKL
jgi:hypothetical protein